MERLAALAPDTAPTMRRVHAAGGTASGSRFDAGLAIILRGLRGG
ncbi:MAG: hypothetical protein ACRD0H_31285 [Actinomycetes bacterium]